MTISLCTRGGIVEDDGGVLEAVDVVGVLLLGEGLLLVGVARGEEARRAWQSSGREGREGRCLFVRLAVFTTLERKGDHLLLTDESSGGIDCGRELWSCGRGWNNECQARTERATQFR